MKYIADKLQILPEVSIQKQNKTVYFQIFSIHSKLVEKVKYKKNYLVTK